MPAAVVGSGSDAHLTDLLDAVVEPRPHQGRGELAGISIVGVIAAGRSLMCGRRGERHGRVDGRARQGKPPGAHFRS